MKILKKLTVTTALLLSFYLTNAQTPQPVINRTQANRIEGLTIFRDATADVQRLKDQGKTLLQVVCDLKIVMPTCRKHIKSYCNSIWQHRSSDYY